MRIRACGGTGRDYRILELDWHFVAWRMVRLEGVDEASAQGLARMIGKLAGLEMVCSHRHL